MDSKMIPRSCDRETNPEALGASYSKDVIAIAVVSNVGPSNLRIFVREGSGALTHLLGARENTISFGYNLNYNAAVEAMRQEFSIDDGMVGIDDEADQRAQYYRENFCSRVDSAGYRNPASLAGICSFLWHNDKESPVVHAILNGLSVLGKRVREKAAQKRAEEIESLVAQAEYGLDKNTLWLKWTEIELSDGKHIHAPLAIAKKLEELKAATIV